MDAQLRNDRKPKWVGSPPPEPAGPTSVGDAILMAITAVWLATFLFAAPLIIAAAAMHWIFAPLAGIASPFEGAICGAR
jgi:hypothetical protein